VAWKKNEKKKDFQEFVARDSTGKGKRKREGTRQGAERSSLGNPKCWKSNRTRETGGGGEGQTGRTERERRAFKAARFPAKKPGYQKNPVENLDEKRKCNHRVQKQLSPKGKKS